MSEALIGARVSAAERERIKRIAEEAGTTVSDLIKMWAALDKGIHPLVKQTIAELSADLDWSGRNVIECVLLSFRAMMEAYGRTGKDRPSWVLPFLTDDMGRPVLGMELYQALVKRFCYAFETDPKKRKKLAGEIDSDYDDQAYTELAVKYGGPLRKMN